MVLARRSRQSVITLSSRHPSRRSTCCPADFVLIHGHILTVDAKDPVAQAPAIQLGVIVKFGSDAEVLESAGNSHGLRVIDLQGHTATPQLIGRHAHIADGALNLTASDAHSRAG